MGNGQWAMGIGLTMTNETEMEDREERQWPVTYHDDKNSFSHSQKFLRVVCLGIVTQSVIIKKLRANFLHGI